MLEARVRYIGAEVRCVCLETDKCDEFDYELCEKCFVKIIHRDNVDQLNDEINIVKNSVDKLNKKIKKEVHQINKVNRKFLK
jgi:hypothetical protein